jgi:hypothetical protein
MHFNHFDSTILGTIFNGQGIAVVATHRSKLRVLVSKFARLAALRLGSWRALTRTSAGLTPAMAMCPSDSAARRQRPLRWEAGVVVDDGTVGVC